MSKLPIKTKRWEDPREPDDGFRVLVCRYRPRALPKSEETWDAWWKELGPSKELHAAYWGKGQAPIGWDEYARRYVEEMKSSAAKIAWLASAAKRGERVTLLCSSACTDEKHCHRTLLRQLIERAATGQ